MKFYLSVNKNYTNKITGNKIRIEATSMCQLRCPVCLQRKGKINVIGKGYLKFEDFKNFISSNLYLKNVELSNWGEMFLNPDLKKIIRFTYGKGINLTAMNGVNLNTIDKETAKYLVRYLFKAMTVSIDGATNNTYKIYRKRGNFDAVIDNINKINYFKQKYKIKLPKLYWQFIIFGHNEHELPRARKMAKELNMEFAPFFNADLSYSPLKNKDFVRRHIGVASAEEYEFIHERLYFSACKQLWDSPQINWDGKLLGCCANTWGSFGNVFKSNLENCLSSEKYIYAMNMVLGKKAARKDIPCFHCPTYKRMQASKSFFKLH